MKKFLIFILIIFVTTLIAFFMLAGNHSNNLINAIESNDYDRVATLIEQHPEAINELPSRLPHFLNVLLGNQNFYPLEVACKEGNFEIAQLLVESGADINARDPYIGTTPLLITLSSTGNSNRFDIAIYLVENGANVNVHRELYPYKNVLSQATILVSGDDIEKSKELFDILYSQVNHDEVDWEMLYLKSSSFGNEYVLSKVVDNHNIDIDYTDGTGRTALINSIINEKIDVALYLIDIGVDITITDENGKTALDYVKDKNLTEVLEALEQNTH